MKLRIEKHVKTVWGQYNWGSVACHDKKVVSWEVFLGDKRIYGGIEAGNNTRGGYAKCETRKEAREYVRGFEAFIAGEPRGDEYDHNDNVYNLGWDRAAHMAVIRLRRLVAQ